MKGRIYGGCVGGGECEVELQYESNYLPHPKSSRPSTLSLSLSPFKLTGERRVKPREEQLIRKGRYEMIGSKCYGMEEEKEK